MEEKNSARIQYHAYLAVCYNLEREVATLLRIVNELLNIENWRKHEETELGDVSNDNRVVNVINATV